MDNESTVLFHIKPSSGKPIYRQIIDQVVRLVSSGYLKPGDELPSIRRMASDFEVNQMTISKAYSLLEAKGFLERSRGKKMVVADNRENRGSLEERLQLIRPVLMEAVTQGKQLALPGDVILKEFRKILEEQK